MNRSKTGMLSFRGLDLSFAIGIGKALSISVLNQVVSSATNFLLGFYLVRVLSAEEFGLYGIGIAVSLLYVGSGNALFLTQMVVHTPDKQLGEREHYAARMLMGVGAYSAAATVFVTATVLLGSIWSNWIWLHATLILSITAAAVSALFKAFIVRQAYTARVESRALMANISGAVTIVVLLAVFHLKGGITASWQVLLIYAAGQFAGTGSGLILAKLPCRVVDWRSVLADAREAFVGGRWALGGITVTWLQAQAYTYVTAFALGAAGVGHANAARLMISPLMFLMPALNQLTLPRLAELRARDHRRMLNVGSLITLGLIILAGLYTGILLCFADEFASLLLGERYQEYQGIALLIAIWCLVMHMQILRSGASSLLQALKNFRALMIANVFSAIVAVFCAFALIKLIGIPGAVLGTGLGELCLAALLWRHIWNDRKNSY